ncbi:MAG: hypothetical protein GXO11_07195 [Epsilonproteobacteria bacterium]|nr:hypothetical protein [Campylobacterota bacterium]
MQEEQKVKKGKNAITFYIIFFFVMIAFIAIAPFIAIDNVKHKTSLPPKERIK